MSHNSTLYRLAGRGCRCDCTCGWTQHHQTTAGAYAAFTQHLLQTRQEDPR